MIKDTIARANENVAAGESEGASAVTGVYKDAVAVSVMARVQASGYQVGDSIVYVI